MSQTKVVKLDLMSSYFNNLNSLQKEGLKNWLMRQYFTSKNHQDLWYSSTITSDSVLGYVSNPKNNFPLTPKEIVDFYKSMKSIQSTLNVKEFNDLLEKVEEEEQEEEIKKGKHFLGESTLEIIGNELGQITRTMVNKIENKALEKYKWLYNNKYPNELSNDELDEIFEKISEAQNRAADNFIQLMNQSNNPKEFLDLILSKDLISSRERISDREQYGLTLIFNKNPELIKEILIFDCVEDDNIFKTFQYFISSELYQTKRRGRPMKIHELNGDND